jgi:hypothetical protein
MRNAYPGKKPEDCGSGNTDEMGVLPPDLSINKTREQPSSDAPAAKLDAAGAIRERTFVRGAIWMLQPHRRFILRHGCRFFLQLISANSRNSVVLPYIL